MPCNPAIGGTAKGPPRPRDRRARRPDGPGDRRDRHSVQAAQPQPRPGGVVAARAGGQARATARGCGDALDGEPNIDVGDWDGRRGCVVERRPGRVASRLEDGDRRTRAAALVVTTGTFLNGLIHVGPEQRPAGALGEPPSHDAGGVAPRRSGSEMGRLKTGTPPRLRRGSIDFDAASSRGASRSSAATTAAVPFSFMTRPHRRATQVAVLAAAHDRARPRARAGEHRPSRRCTTARSRASARATARRSRTRSCGFPTASATRSSSSRKGSTSTRSTSTASR